MRSGSKEKELRAKVVGRSQKVEDYMELASLLYETRRFEEAVDILKRGLTVPFRGINRAALLTSLGWYVHTITHGVDEPRALGEQAVALTEGIETGEALLARAKAKSLIASCASRNDLTQAKEIAASALSLLDRVLDADTLREAMPFYEALLEAARLNCLLGRFEDAAIRCEQAQRSASDTDQELNCLIELGTIYREAGRLVEARETFTKAFRFRTWFLLRSSVRTTNSV